MSKLKKSDVEHVAKLSKLDFTDKELEKYQSQLSSVLDFFEQLNEVDTSGVEPTAQTTGLENITRSDEIDAANILPEEDALSGTEKVHNNYFIVPRLIKNE